MNENLLKISAALVMLEDATNVSCIEIAEILTGFLIDEEEKGDIVNFITNLD